MTLNMQMNHRQATYIGLIITSLLDQGLSKKKVVESFQEALVNIKSERGFVCLVDQKTGTFLAHPDKALVGTQLKMLNMKYTPINAKTRKEAWLEAIEKKDFSTGGILTSPTGHSELMDSYLVPGTDIRVFSHVNLDRLNQRVAHLDTVVIIAFIVLGFLVAFPASFAALKVSRRYERQIEKEQEKSEKLLLNILPPSIAERLKADEKNIANYFTDVSVMFIDIVDFTPLTHHKQPERLVKMLNHIFSYFDAISKKYQLEKIKTIGDAYMLAGGIPETNPQHLRYAVKASIEMMEYIHQNFTGDKKLQIRIGLHTGPVVAGVIGTYKFTYDLWGDTVNLASRLESTAPPGGIHCSQAVYERMKDVYTFDYRGETELKGLGKVPTYLLQYEE